ncbi:hypothetical protein Taro_027793 [Colocasia esculenta]|uniref:Uncharacterized protein n=1 Tax=Colocasia esculenta TaxID=4460 RepID=A0A843VFI5_COLES|nr:hypothetical protein [Colocasia esculenta]
MVTPDLVELRDVGGCVVTLWSHVVSPVFRELLCLGGCVPRCCFHIVFDSAGSAGVVFGPTLVGLAIAGVRCRTVMVPACSPCVASSVSCEHERLYRELRVAFLQVLRVYGSVGGGMTFGGPWRGFGRSGRCSGIRAQGSNEICNGWLAFQQGPSVSCRRVLLLLLGARATSVVAVFARATVGFVLGLSVHVGVSRRLREPACGVAFTGAGLLPVDPVEVRVPLPLGLLLCSLKSSTVLPLWFEVSVVWLVAVALPSRLRCIAWLPCVLVRFPRTVGCCPSEVRSQDCSELVSASCCATSGLRYAAVVLAIVFWWEEAGCVPPSSAFRGCSGWWCSAMAIGVVFRTWRPLWRRSLPLCCLEVELASSRCVFSFVPKLCLETLVAVSVWPSPPVVVGAVPCVCALQRANMVVALLKLLVLRSLCPCRTTRAIWVRSSGAGGHCLARSGFSTYVFSAWFWVTIKKLSFGLAVGASYC